MYFYFRRTVSTFLFTFFIFSHSAWGWGAVGHRTVALIAETQLKPETKTALKRLLAFYTLADVANWADSIKSDGLYRQTSWYHFESVPDSLNYLETMKSLPPKDQKKGGVVTAILYANQILRNPQASIKEQAAALRFLVHFVGDIHQPLHSGRPGDMGGLKIYVNWFGNDMSLHQIWDSGIIERAHCAKICGLMSKNRAEVYAKIILARPMPPPVDPTMDVEGWLNEAIVLRPGAYDHLALKDPKSYVALHAPEIDQAIYAAGVRLAALLNDIYSNDVTPSPALLLQKNVETLWGTSLEKTMSFEP